MASTLNLASLKTPGVYIDEVSLLPPAVAQVETAIPAFIGYTEFALKDGRDITRVPTRIKSMKDYEKYFGGTPGRDIEVTLDPLNAVAKAEVATAWYLYDSLQMFFANGGEKCYIVSVGAYTDAPAPGDFTSGLDALQRYDEPTLLVMPDLMRLAATSPPTALEKAQIAGVQQTAIDQCNTLKDRFAVLDVLIADLNNPEVNIADLDDFRNGVSNNLKYAAAYYPWLKTSLQLDVNFATLTIMKGSPAIPVDLDTLLSDPAQVTLATSARDYAADWTTAIGLLPDSAAYYNRATRALRRTDINGTLAAFTGLVAGDFDNPGTVALLADYQDTTTPTVNGAKLAAISAAAAALDDTVSFADHDKVFEQAAAFLAGFAADIKARLDADDARMRATIPLYASIVAAAVNKGIVLPPSGPVVGIYAAVDEARGVWKAPANVGISNVVGPTVFINDKDQEEINVDVTAGKSINAIRTITGRGSAIIWGARTLAGNDLEWRYVPVRRFFNMVEESVKKASGQFVFEPNDANTWVKVRAMIENFLTLQWRAGALAGAKPEHAFFVRVGLGQTMTAEDILQGFMIVEIGMAVVRPAEFIVLRFSHKMQES